MQDDNGYELSVRIHGEEINRTDAQGMSLLEGIYRGFDWRCRFTGLEWNKSGLLGALQAFGKTGTNQQLRPKLANVGDRFSKYAQAMVLTAVLGDPPTTPQTLTASSAILAPNMQALFRLTSQMRTLPLEFVFLPYSSTISATTSSVPFTTT